MKRVDHGSAWSPCSEILRLIFVVRSGKSITSPTGNLGEFPRRLQTHVFQGTDSLNKMATKREVSINSYRDPALRRQLFPRPNPLTPKPLLYLCQFPRLFLGLFPYPPATAPGRRRLAFKRRRLAFN